MALGLVFVLGSLPDQSSLAIAASSAPTVQANPPAAPPQINVEINKGGGGGRAWYASPVWIAIGVIALVLVVMLVAMAARGGGGGGTTVVRG
jgi:hypothetical protein